MDYYAGLDVSLELSSVCILYSSGQIVREAKVASEPETLATFLAGLKLPLTRAGLEAGPLSQWLHAGLRKAGFEVVQDKPEEDARSSHVPHSGGANVDHRRRKIEGRVSDNQASRCADAPHGNV